MLDPRMMSGILGERDGPLVVAIDDRGSEGQRRSGGDEGFGRSLILILRSGLIVGGEFQLL